MNLDVLILLCLAAVILLFVILDVHAYIAAVKLRQQRLGYWDFGPDWARYPFGGFADWIIERRLRRKDPRT